MKVIALGLAAGLTLSAPANAEDSAQYWWTLVGDVKVDDNDTVTGAVIIRSRPDTLEPGQRFLRTGMSHRLQNGISLSVGYTHVTTLNDNAPNSVQHRVSQGIGFPVGKIADSLVDVRFQAEEIFTPGRRDIGVRGRGRVRLLKPLDAAGAVDVQLSDELIWSINSTDWGQKSGWTANRAALALHVKLNKRVGIAPGYTWQLVNKTSGPNRNDHIFGLTADVHF